MYKEEYGINLLAKLKKDINNMVLSVIIVLKFFFLCMKFNLER